VTKEEFIEEYSGDSRQIKSCESICGQWEKELALDELLHTSVGSGIVIGDLLVGDGLNDQISDQLLDAFKALMGEKANSYAEVRNRLLGAMQKGDKSVFGLINKIKGQLGENQFLKEAQSVGLNARLASSGNQEGWDVAFDHENGTTQYIQVKTYSNPDGVISHMKEVNQKLSEGVIISDGEQIVEKIDFAVPADIAEQVRERALELGIESTIIPINMTAEEAKNIVETGFNNVGPEAISNLFGALFGASVPSAALHTLVNGFLVYKGAKTVASFLPDTIEQTAISTGGLAAGMSLELLLNKISMIGGPPTFILTLCASGATRGVLKRFAKRQGYVSCLREQTIYLKNLNNCLDFGLKGYRIRLDRESGANHNLNRLLYEPGC